MGLLGIIRVTALCLFVLAACGDDTEPVAADDVGGTPAGAPSLDGEYRSIAVTAAGEPRPLVGPGEITLRFEGTTVSANAGCNTLGGDFRVEGATFMVDELFQTDMGCDADLMAQDAWLSGYLAGRPTITVDPGAVGTTPALEFTGADPETGVETVIGFVTAATAEPDVALVGTTWTVTGYVDGDTASSPAMAAGPDADAGTEPHIVFDPNGLMTGHDGCNGFGFGTAEGEEPMGLRYAIDGDVTADGGATVTFTGSAASTLKACADIDVSRFFAVLVGSVTAEVDGSDLVLTAPDGRGVTYRARP